jgi:transcriptional antiterminator RfaH
MTRQQAECDLGEDSDVLIRAEWLCVMCKARQENTAEYNLKRQGFQVYLPTVPEIERNQGRITKNIKAMFPGYLFIEADLESQDLSVIRSTLGCIALLRRGAHPAVVPQQVMTSIVEAETVLQGRSENDQGFTPGAHYELLGHGFQGHTATFLALEGKERARVLLTLLNSQQEVRVPTRSLGQMLQVDCE